MTEPKKSSTKQDWLIALALGLASSFVVFWQNSRLTVLWDLSYILENSYRISLGDIPYRDFPFPYAPLTFVTQACIIKLTGRVFFHHVIYCAIIAAASTLLTWRILLRVLSGVARGRSLAIIITTPLVFLGIYAIFPHPFYDPDCSFVVLICLLIFTYWEENNVSPLRALSTGLLLPIPLFIKQNTGLAFLVSAITALTFLSVWDGWRRRPLRKYRWLLSGLVVTLVLAATLIHLTAGLGNYFRWTVRFAAERRTPAWAEMIGIYNEQHLKWWLLMFLAGAVLLTSRKGGPWLKAFSVVLMTMPFIWPVVYLFLDRDSSERAERLINLWPLLLILAVVMVVLTIRRRGHSELLLIIVVVGTAHGAFLSQQLWGSTYALWPFFMILFGLTIRGLIDFVAAREEIEPTAASSFPLWSIALVSVVSLSLLIAGAYYLRSHERLDYANLDEGELVHSNLAALRGLSIRGSWLPDFEELVAFVQKEIPFDDGILYLPGEDLFYYSTGRHPRFPVLMFDHTVNPLSPREIVEVARERNIQWLITKNDLQLQEEPVEKKEEVMNLLLSDFESVESLNNYEIYKRRSPDANVNDEDADDSDAPSDKP